MHRNKNALGIRLVDRDLDLFDAVHGLTMVYVRKGFTLGQTDCDGTCQLGCLTEALHDDMRADALFDICSNFFEKLGGKEHDAGCSVSDLCILCAGDVDEGAGCGMDDVKQLEDGRAIVCDLCVSAVGDDELVHAAGAEGGGDGVRDGETGVDVGEQLGRALGRVGALLEEDDRRLLQ
jgi:hypothetical protein